MSVLLGTDLGLYEIPVPSGTGGMAHPLFRDSGGNAHLLAAGGHKP